jgi:hypothetical protein
MTTRHLIGAAVFAVLCFWPAALLAQTIRVTQAPVEVLVDQDPTVRVTQVTIEVVVLAGGPARLSPFLVTAARQNAGDAAHADVRIAVAHYFATPLQRQHVDGLRDRPRGVGGRVGAVSGSRPWGMQPTPCMKRKEQ